MLKRVSIRSNSGNNGRDPIRIQVELIRTFVLWIGVLMCCVQDMNDPIRMSLLLSNVNNLIIMQNVFAESYVAYKRI